MTIYFFNVFASLLEMNVIVWNCLELYEQPKQVNHVIMFRPAVAQLKPKNVITLSKKKPH